MDKKIKILSWNIHHGGNKKYIDDIIKSIYKKNANINILTEFRENTNAYKIREFFEGKGFKTISSNPKNSDNGILLITKFNVKIKGYDGGNKNLPVHRWLDISFIDYDFNILAIHIPGGGDKYDKRIFWEEISKYTEDNINNNNLIIGDYNTGFKYDTQCSPFILGKYMYKLVERGWIDIWNKFNKEIDFTWYSNKGNGFRIDHIFTTRTFEKNIVNSYFSHKERKLKYSDHSMLLVELGK